MLIVFLNFKKKLLNYTISHLCLVEKSLGFTVWILMTQPENVHQRLPQNLFEISLSTTDLSIHNVSTPYNYVVMRSHKIVKFQCRDLDNRVFSATRY